ncbi:MAG: hypothetical protein OXE84_05375 [Rhodobacteraceae bacterium]|nr:hypothetical protein [Paracoccaceae bacterium]MCY4197215.1 hypothetical protein [Paracoccaceae bacterium]
MGVPPCGQVFVLEFVLEFRMTETEDDIEATLETALTQVHEQDYVET